MSPYLKSIALCALILALAACNRSVDQPAKPAPPPAQVDDARLARADAEPQNWLAHGGNQQAQRFSGLDQITPDNVSRLKPAGTWNSTPTAGRNPRPSSSTA